MSLNQLIEQFRLCKDWIAAREDKLAMLERSSKKSSSRDNPTTVADLLVQLDEDLSSYGFDSSSSPNNDSDVAYHRAHMQRPKSSTQQQKLSHRFSHEAASNPKTYSKDDIFVDAGKLNILPEPLRSQRVVKRELADITNSQKSYDQVYEKHVR